MEFQFEKPYIDELRAFRSTRSAIKKKLNGIPYSAQIPKNVDAVRRANVASPQ